MSAWFAVTVFAGAYVLIATEWVHRVKVALVGAGLMVAGGVLGADDVFYEPETGVDWNVIFLLLGMMVIVGVIKQTGVFEYLAIWAAKRARGDPYRVLVLLCLITAVASAGLDNVTTVLLVAPVTLLVCDRIGVAPVPYLIAEALASNIGGAGTLIGDPPNLIIASRAGLGFNDFLVNLGPIVVVLLVVFVLVSRVLFRDAFVADPERVDAVMQLTEREAIADVRLLVRSAVVLVLVLAGFVTQELTGVEPALVALLGAGVLVLVSGLESRTYLAEIEWETLLFFAGLFVMVGALVATGVVEQVATYLAELVAGNLALAVIVLLVASAVLSAIVDNIPYVATMAPVVAAVMAGDPALQGQDVLWWALALGADLGGNATAIGASANVVVTGIAARSGNPISFWEFAKYGSVVAALTIVLCIPYLYLRYL
jgi:Na+/H+ antiporter NhaD/arsenite permease-like protein